MISAGTPVISSPRSSVHSCTDAWCSSKPVVACSMKAVFARPAAKISRAIVFESAMSDPTSIPSHRSAHCAEVVLRGSTTIRRAPFRMPFRTWWKKIGCVSRAFDPHSTMRSVFSTSSYELVPPPAPNTVARPTTLGACQVRLQLSTLLLRRTCRMNFCDTKFISFVAFEQLNRPTPLTRLTPGYEGGACGAVDRGLICSFGQRPGSRGRPRAARRSAERLGRDAIGVRVDVEAAIAHERDERHPEMIGRLHGETRKRADRAHDRDPRAAGLLHELERQAARDLEQAVGERWTADQNLLADDLVDGVVATDVL